MGVQPPTASHRIPDNPDFHERTLPGSIRAAASAPIVSRRGICARERLRSHIRNRRTGRAFTETVETRVVFVYTVIAWRGRQIKLEWDQAKAETNEAKHGVSFEAARAFEFDTALIVEDDRANYGETRLVAIGLIGSRVHVIVYTERRNTIRVISLRKANRREIETYVQSF